MDGHWLAATGPSARDHMYGWLGLIILKGNDHPEFFYLSIYLFFSFVYLGISQSLLQVPSVLLLMEFA